jgi:CDP-Glycerol:Poly(glycerophosphate) glycerophosphotransferase
MKVRENNMDRPTIVLAAPMWSSVRDLLRTDVLKILKAEGAEIVVITPSAVHAQFVEEFDDKNVTLVKMAKPPQGFSPKLERFFASLSMVCMSRYVRTIRIKHESVRGARRWYRAFTRILDRIPQRGCLHLMRLFRYLRFLATRGNLYEDVFAQFRPDLVVCNLVLSTGPRFLDRYVLVEAKKRGVPTAVIVASWDNLSSKGSFPCVPDALLVWNSIMRREAIEFHGISSDLIHVCGAPAHDFFANASLDSLPDRNTFCQTLGLNPNHKIVTYASAGFGTLPEETDLIDEIYQALCEKLVDLNWQMLVRPHPVSKKSEFQSLLDRSRLVVDVPGTPVKGSVGRDLDRMDIRHFLATLTHSDVVLNFFSTINIDTAAMDCPAINVAFTPFPHSEFGTSPLRFMDYNHNATLLKSGNVLIARDIDELITLVRACIMDRTTNREGRLQVVTDHCWKLDGNSSARVAAVLLSLAGNRIQGASALSKALNEVVGFPRSCRKNGLPGVESIDDTVGRSHLNDSVAPW